MLIILKSIGIKNRLIISNIIYKDTSLPAEATSSSLRLEDGNYDTYIAIYESECCDERYLPEKGTYIGNVTISGIEMEKKRMKLF